MSREWFILAVAGGASGLARAWRRREASWIARLALVTLPVLLVALIYIYHETAVLNTRWTWSACRLAPVFGWLHHYPLYSPVDSGPINGWLYGPVAAIAWLPAAAAGSPQSALLAAAVINLLFLLVPLLGAARQSAPGSTPAAGFAFVAAAAGLLLVYPTWYMASALNVDAVAVGLGTASCLLLSSGAPDRRRLGLAALLSVLAVWTKQVEAPLVFAQCGWLWFRRGRRAAVTFALAYGATTLVVAGAVGALLNVRDVIFNLWTVPSHHPFLGGWSAARTELLDLGRYTFVLWVPVVVELALGFRFPRPATDAAVSAPAADLFFLAALVLLPSGILATIKLGGDRNSLHSVYYLVVAALLALAANGAIFRGRFREAHLALLAASAAGTTGFCLRQVNGYAQLPMLPPRCLSQEAWTFAREQPGGVYFPWDPLATLMAERKMYHFEYGVYDRIQAGRAPTAAHLAAGLPVKLELVAYPKADYPRTMLRSLPGYTLSATTDDWLLYRPGPTQSAPSPTP